MIKRADWMVIGKNGKKVLIAKIEISSSEEISDKQIFSINLYGQMFPVILLETENDKFEIIKLQSTSKQYMPDGYAYIPKGTIEHVFDYDMLKELLG